MSGPPVDDPGWLVVDFSTGYRYFGPETFGEALADVAEDQECSVDEITWDDKSGPQWTTYGPDNSNTGLSLMHEFWVGRDL